MQRSPKIGPFFASNCHSCWFLQTRCYLRKSLPPSCLKANKCLVAEFDVLCLCVDPEFQCCWARKSLLLACCRCRETTRKRLEAGERVWSGSASTTTGSRLDPDWIPTGSQLTRLSRHWRHKKKSTKTRPKDKSPNISSGSPQKRNLGPSAQPLHIPGIACLKRRSAQKAHN